MGEETFRVLAALRELEAERTDPPPVLEIATRSAVSVGVAERELDTLDAVDAAETVDDDAERFAPKDTSVEDVARRVDTVDELDADERSALLEALRTGTSTPATSSTTSTTPATRPNARLAPSPPAEVGLDVETAGRRRTQ